MPENDINKESVEENILAETNLDLVETEICDKVDTEILCDADANADHNTSDAAPADKAEKPRLIESIFEFVELLLLTLAAVFIVTTFIFRHSVVDGDSMMNTLQHEDVLIISGLFYTPEQYDIVVIEDHSTGYTHPLVKRVIAVGGDKVRVTKYGISVNGEMLNEAYVFIDEVGYTYDVSLSDVLSDNPTFVYEEGVYYEFEVPEGEIFVLGDHRNNSADSRKFGTVSADAVLGKVLFRVYPFSEFGLVDKGEE